MTNYKYKYLKYKTKYRRLKNNQLNKDLKRIPGGKRSGLPFDELVKMIRNKTAIFFLDKAEPKDFPKNSEMGIKPGQHIHKIFKKGEKWNNNGTIIILKGTINDKGFIKIIKDNNGKEWAILDHNLNPYLDELLINSLKL